jgi:membrane protein YdbS with pleckstrin-like domain
VLEDDKIVIVKGVWWRNKSFVPYNRITNVNIYQGPISRRFRLGKLSIQTQASLVRVVVKRLLKQLFLG